MSFTATSKSFVREVLTQAMSKEYKKLSCYSCKKRNCKLCEENHSFHLRLAGSCSRLIALHWLIGEKEVDSISRRRMLQGELFHLGLKTFFEKNGVLVDAEVELRKKYKSGLILSGKVDYIIRVSDKEVPVELKTFTSAKTHHLPRAQDVAQLEVYLELLKDYEVGELIYAPVGSISLMTESSIEIEYYRDFKDWKFFPIKKGNSYVSKFQRIFKLLQEGTLPKKEVSNWCKYCNYKTECLSTT